MRLCRIQHSLLERFAFRTVALAKTCGDHDSGTATHRAEFGYQPGYRRWRGCNDSEIGRERQFVDRAVV